MRSIYWSTKARSIDRISSILLWSIGRVFGIDRSRAQVSLPNRFPGFRRLNFVWFPLDLNRTNTSWTLTTRFLVNQIHFSLLLEEQRREEDYVKRSFQIDVLVFFLNLKIDFINHNFFNDLINIMKLNISKYYLPIFLELTIFIRRICIILYRTQ